LCALLNLSGDKATHFVMQAAYVDKFSDGWKQSYIIPPPNMSNVFQYIRYKGVYLFPFWTRFVTFSNYLLIIYSTRKKGLAKKSGIGMQKS